MWRMEVAPYAGAWIEIFYKNGFDYIGLSLPTRERGLKLRESWNGWNIDSRSLRGSVD